jgi:hypothetical protein
MIARQERLHIQRTSFVRQVFQFSQQGCDGYCTVHDVRWSAVSLANSPSYAIQRRNGMLNILCIQYAVVQLCGAGV